MRKLFIAETWIEDAADMMDLCAPDSLLEQGVDGCGRRRRVELSYRHSTALSIYGGSSEIMRSIIAQVALGHAAQPELSKHRERSRGIVKHQSQHSDAITTQPLSPMIGAEVVEVDRDALLHDPEVPEAVLEALEAHGVLLFRELGLDDEDQVALGLRLGELVARPGYPIPEINVITQDPENPMAEYLKGNAQWHIDGALDRIPSKAGILTARVISSGDSGTEFASTYAAYDDLEDEEHARLEDLRVMHSMESTLRGVVEDPTPEQLANWRQRHPYEHPLVWQHRSGRKSLVIGATADYIVDMDVEAGRRAPRRPPGACDTHAERVVRHDWTVGDMVIWDNTGVLHRVTGHHPRSTHASCTADARR